MKFFRPLFSPLPVLTFVLAMSVAWVLGEVLGEAAVAPVAPEAPTATAMGWAALLIPLTTPILIAAFKQLIPKIPRVALPVAAPLIGAALQIVLNYAGMTDADTLTGMVLGAAGVALREAVDQVKKLGGPPAGGFYCLLAIGFLMTGCARYTHTRQTATGPESTKITTFLMLGNASKINSVTKDGTYHRTLGVGSIQAQGDADLLRTIIEAGGTAAATGAKAVAKP
ncbi:MAG: hypothetical protein AB9869_01185 [Verrucomicrobiia bacterium]